MAIGLRMDDEVLQVAVGLRLGVALCRPHKCHQCGAEVDHLGLHGLSCRRSQGRYPRQAAVNDLLKRTLASAKIPSLFVKVHLSTFRASRDAVFSILLLCQTFRPWGSSSVTGVGLQGGFIYRHLFPPFSITSSVMSSVTSFPEEGEVKGVFIKKGFQPFLSTIP